MAMNERKCTVEKITVEGNTANIVVRIRGGLRNLTGDRENWSAMTDYPLAFSVKLEDLVERFASERKIALARVLRNTSPAFIAELNEADVPWTMAEIQAKAAPFQMDESKLAETIAKLEEKLAAAKAKLAQ